MTREDFVERLAECCVAAQELYDHGDYAGCLEELGKILQVQGDLYFNSREFSLVRTQVDKVRALAKNVMKYGGKDNLSQSVHVAQKLVCLRDSIFEEPTAVPSYERS